MGKKKGLTRREFISASAIQVSGSVCLPSLATLLYNGRALAGDNCPKTEVMSDAPAFIAIDLQGGASIAGNNVMVYDSGGGILDDYRGLGLTPDLHPQGDSMINTELGLPMHAESPMLRGIKAVAAQALDKVNGCVICTQSADDTSNNRLATAPGVFMGGAKGVIVPLVGTNPSFPGGSGGNSVTPFITGATPAFIQDIRSAQQLISPGEFWMRSPKRMEGVLSLIKDMSHSQIRRFSQLSLSEQAKKIVECGYSDARDLLVVDKEESGRDSVSTEDLDPRNNDKLPSSILNQPFEAAIEVAYLVLQSYAGSGTIALGGYDYHDSTATTGEERDEIAGRVIGTVLAMAAALGRKVMIHVYTDGGVDADYRAEKKDTIQASGVEKYVWRGDSEARAAAFVLVYDPSSRAALNFQQMGAYKSNDGGTVNLNPERHVKISQNPAAQAAAVVANWLSWQGREGELSSIMKDSPLRDDELDDYLFIKKS